MRIPWHSPTVRPRAPLPRRQEVDVSVRVDGDRLGGDGNVGCRDAGGIDAV
jgi:hypothetical protein